MNSKPNSYKSFGGYVFSNKRTVKILQTIVIFYLTSEIFISEICQRIDIVSTGSEIRYVVIILILIPLSWIFFRIISDYLRDNENKSLWIYVFSGKRNALILQIPLMSCLFSKLIGINMVTIFIETLIILAIIFFKAIHLYYISEYNNKSLDIDKKEDLHFSRYFSQTEQTILFNELIAGGYLDKETDFNDFCHVFRTSDYIDTGREFYGLKWIKPTRSKTRSIRDLLYLLAILEIPENEIKNKKLLNLNFNTGALIQSNNFTDITDHNHNLKPFKSGYHEDLDRIVSKSKEK
jgi:hypothetical protein